MPLTMPEQMDNLSSTELIALEDQYGARNYKPLDVVIARGEGVWVWDVEGKKYLDCLAAYSAVNQGHCHPRIIEALKTQAEKLTLTSRAFRNDQLGLLYRDLCELSGREMALPMNSGAEAVETAIKAIRKWAHSVKGIPIGEAEIIVCSNNFHGRTTTIVSFSTEEGYRHWFKPFTPGFKAVPYGDLEALRAEANDKTAAILFEPIQGEGGIQIPPDGYLRGIRELCDERNVLMVSDEIQTGLGRTGKFLAEEHEGVRADVVLIGKALTGGVYPASAMLASREVLGVFQPGEHGSTYGGNPLACAVARAALRVLIDEGLIDNAAELGPYVLEKLRALESPHVKEIRGRGLMIGIELKEDAGGARRFCERLQELGVLCKETHSTIIRIAPPLVITREQADWMIEQIAVALA